MLSGIGAAIEIGGVTESTTRQWWVRDRGMHPRFVATNTGGAENTINGNTDWIGRYLTYGHTPVPFPGEAFDFTGSIEGTNGVIGPARCKQIMVTCHGERGAIIESQVDFEANGAIALGAAASSDATAQTALTAIARVMQIDGTPVPQLRMWRLIIGARNRPGVHTGCVTAGQVERTAGDLYARYLYQTYVDDPSVAIQMPAIGSTGIYKFFVTNTLYWQLKWGRVATRSDYGADREGAKNVGLTVGGLHASEIGGGRGNIIDPATVLRWGTA